MATSGDAALPYHEPGIVTILILASFLYLLNVIDSVLDKLLYCGLLGQIFLGVAWGTPGGKWLGVEAEHVITNLGYLGLLLIVYEGGLLTSFHSIKANLSLSACVALTGITVPICLSFSLTGLLNASYLEAFAAGAALCSTSLGTTFTVLSSCGLSHSRLGVVLSTAAMLDDVVGLVLVQVITNLGGSSDFSAVTVIRPVFVSFALAIVVPLVAYVLVRPATLWFRSQPKRVSRLTGHRYLSATQVSFIPHSAILIGLVVASSYAGTSNLFAAYLAGAAISWWDSEMAIHNTEESVELRTTMKQEPTQNRPGTPNPSRHITSSAMSPATTPDITTEHKSTTSDLTTPKPPTTDPSSGLALFNQYYAQPLTRILKPFFFASIGFSVPISKLFTGRVIWKSIIYTILMIIGKVICGIWLLRCPKPSLSRIGRTLKTTTPIPKVQQQEQESNRPALISRVKDPDTTTQTADTPSDNPDSTPLEPPPSEPSNPTSLYPSLILGSAMTARGEIGFLVSAIASSNGIFGSDPSSEVFLVVTWAILLCTIAGPIGVGLLVRRVRRLEGEAKRGKGARERDVLGVWGVS